MYAADEISPGCRFRVLDIEMDEEEEYHFVGTQEIDPINNKISDESPFGKAMLGKKVGAIVDVETPSKDVIKFKVLEIIK